MILACCLVGLAPQAPAPARPWQGFERILYLHGGPTRDAAFFAQVKALGFTAVNVAGGEDPELPGRHGLRFYRDQLVGKGVLELRDPEWLAAYKAYDRTRDARDLVRPRCLAAADVRQELADLCARNLAACLPAGPIAVALGDEISITRHANPLDFCYAEASLTAFRAELLGRHGTVEALNAAWDTTFPSFAHVVPLTADQIRRREFGDGLARNLRPWAEHREFMDAQFATVLTDLAARVRAAQPGLPIGLTGMQPPSAYGGHDYRRLMPWQDFYEAYDLGGARQLAMSLAPAGARQIATIAPPPPGVGLETVQAQVAAGLAHGMAGVVVWSAGTVFTAGGTPTEFGLALRDAFAALAPVAERVAGAQVEFSPIWLVESQASVRAWWMLDSEQDGKTWIRRLSSYESTHSTSLAARASWVQLLQDLGYQPLLVPEQDLPRRLAQETPRAVVLPATLALTAAAVRALENYRGLLLADHSVGLYDEHLQLRAAPVLEERFGLEPVRDAVPTVRVREGRPPETLRLPSGACAVETGRRGRLGEPCQFGEVQMEATGRDRTACYLNLAVCEYSALRLDPQRVATARDLRVRVARALRLCGLEPTVHVVGDGLPTCVERIWLRSATGARTLAIRLDALANPAVAAEIGRRGAARIEVLLPAPLRLRDLSGGDPSEATTRQQHSLQPWRGLFLAVEGGR